MGEPGLVSRALLEETTKKVRELGLVVWVDAEGHYSAWGDRLAAQSGTPAAPFPFPIVRYRNSFLELMRSGFRSRGRSRSVGSAQPSRFASDASSQPGGSP